MPLGHPCGLDQEAPDGTWQRQMPTTVRLVDLGTDRGRGPIGAALGEALAEAIEGSGRLVLLLGEAGIGKTTTARDAAASARRGGVNVRWSACSSGGGTVAHAPWLTLLS